MKTKVVEDIEVDRKKVCIIGAGPAGLVSTKHFSKYHDVDTFEGRDDIGGLWNFSEISELTHPDLKNDEYFKLYGHLHPSIYKNMTTNLPKYLMTLKDYPHKEETPLMMQPNQYQDYLRSYVHDFGLEKYIHLNTLVTHIKLIRNCTPEQLSEFSEEQLRRKFIVTTKNVHTRETKKETYDHVVCCNGRNSKKFIPPFKGKDEWDGLQLHMHEFRDIDKELYKDKTVMVVGTSISASDFVYHLLMSPWKAQPKKCYLTGSTMTFITKSTDFKGLTDTGKLEFCSANISGFKQGESCSEITPRCHSCEF